MIAGMHDEPPYMQGHELAHELRSKRGVTGSSGRVDPVMILESLSVPLVNPDYSCFPPHRRTSGHVNVMNCGRPLVTQGGECHAQARPELPKVRIPVQEPRLLLRSPYKPPIHE